MPVLHRQHKQSVGKDGSWIFFFARGFLFEKRRGNTANNPGALLSQTKFLTHLQRGGRLPKEEEKEGDLCHIEPLLISPNQN